MRPSTRFIPAAAAVCALVVSSVALASGSVAGTYTTTLTKPAELKGKWGLALAKGGSYTVFWNGRTAARGKYAATANTITFIRETGSPCKGSGTYGWRKSGKTMTFVLKREAASCQARAAVLSHRFTQVR